MSNNEGPFFTPHFGMDSGLADEHCKANLKQIRDIGRHRHEQVRIEFPRKGAGLLVQFIQCLHFIPMRMV